jgi:hypothetical protein
VGPTDHSAGLRGGVGRTFSREQLYSSNTINDLQKVATYEDRLQEAYAGHRSTGVRRLRVVLVGFSPA